MPNLNTSILSDVPALLPPIALQRGIAATLGALDDKIESNRRLIKRGNDLCSNYALELVLSQHTVLTELADVVEFNPGLISHMLPSEEIDYIDIAAVEPGRVMSVRRVLWSEAPSRARRRVSDGDVIYSTVRPNRRSFSLLIDPTPDTVVSTGFAVIRPSRMR